MHEPFDGGSRCSRPGTAQVSQYGSACAVARITGSGTLDPTFDVDGKATAGTAAGCQGIVLQPDGKILALGWTRPATIGGLDSTVFRFGAAGALDTTFHDGGSSAVTFGSSIQQFMEGRVLADGRLLVVGQTSMYQVGLGLGRFWL
ncbi:hypothetical protein BH11MYX4_BH11MYX4_35790 [soil metagenome]